MMGNVLVNSELRFTIVLAIAPCLSEKQNFLILCQFGQYYADIKRILEVIKKIPALSQHGQDRVLINIKKQTDGDR